MGALPLVHTPRLTLRRPTLADAPEIFARYASDPEVVRYLAWPRHRSVTDSEAFVAFAALTWAKQQAGPYLIQLRSSGELLGSTGLDMLDGSSAMTGYVLARSAWGRGFASEALRAMVDIARTLGLRQLHAAVHPENAASVRVLEKAGFLRTQAAPLHGFPNLEGARGPLPIHEYAIRLV